MSMSAFYAFSIIVNIVQAAEGGTSVSRGHNTLTESAAILSEV
jgi:hypothetical protein